MRLLLLLQEKFSPTNGYNTWASKERLRLSKDASAEGASVFFQNVQDLD